MKKLKFLIWSLLYLGIGTIKAQFTDLHDFSTVALMKLHMTEYVCHPECSCLSHIQKLNEKGSVVNCQMRMRYTHF